MLLARVRALDCLRCTIGSSLFACKWLLEGRLSTSSVRCTVLLSTKLIGATRCFVLCACLLFASNKVLLVFSSLKGSGLPFTLCIVLPVTESLKSRLPGWYSFLQYSLRLADYLALTTTGSAGMHSALPAHIGGCCCLVVMVNLLASIRLFREFLAVPKVELVTDFMGSSIWRGTLF